MNRPVTIEEIIAFGEEKLQANLTIAERVSLLRDFISQRATLTGEKILLIIAALKAREQRSYRYPFLFYVVSVLFCFFLGAWLMNTWLGAAGILPRIPLLKAVVLFFIIWAALFCRRLYANRKPRFKPITDTLEAYFLQL